MMIAHVIEALLSGMTITQIINQLFEFCHPSEYGSAYF
jgi:hypothetical protein